MIRIKSLRDEFPSLIDRAYLLLKGPHFVEEIMSKNIEMINIEASMDEAAKLMGAKRIGSLIVESEGKPEGMVTERDLLSKILAKNKNPEKVKVREVISSSLITIEPSATIKKAAQTMISKKSRLAVVTAGKLVGIITAFDLIKSLPENPETKLSVDIVMTKGVTTVSSNTTVEEVVKIMGEKRIGSVIVTRRQKPFGIFTTRDLLRTFLTGSRSLKMNVGTVASSPLITISLGTSIYQATLTMILKNIKRLPVTKDGEIIGIVTPRDLVEAYAA